jgi:hypothetical protein
MKRVFLVGILAGALAAVPLPGAAQAAGGQQTAKSAAAPGQTSLGSVRIPRAVKANGERLAPGTYAVRLTNEEATPDAKGQTESLERWVEFLQGGQVKGREVASIVPDDEIAQVADSKRVPRGSSRVEMLKGNDYLRVWINRGGTNYLIHLPPA